MTLKINNCPLWPRESEVPRLIPQALCPRWRGHFNMGCNIKVLAFSEESWGLWSLQWPRCLGGVHLGPSLRKSCRSPLAWEQILRPGRSHWGPHCSCWAAQPKPELEELEELPGFEKGPWGWLIFRNGRDSDEGNEGPPVNLEVRLSFIPVMERASNMPCSIGPPGC